MVARMCILNQLCNKFESLLKSSLMPFCRLLKWQCAYYFGHDTLCPLQYDTTLYRLLKMSKLVQSFWYFNLSLKDWQYIFLMRIHLQFQYNNLQ